MLKGVPYSRLLIIFVFFVRGTNIEERSCQGQGHSDVRKSFLEVRCMKKGSVFSFVVVIRNFYFYVQHFIDFNYLLFVRYGFVYVGTAPSQLLLVFVHRHVE